MHHHEFDTIWRNSIIGLIVFAVAIVALHFLKYPSNEDIHRVLSGAGYSQIAITGYRYYGCAKGDNYRIGFTAIGHDGKPVSGLVCSTIFKGHTIRVD